MLPAVWLPPVLPLAWLPCEGELRAEAAARDPIVMRGASAAALVGAATVVASLLLWRLLQRAREGATASSEERVLRPSPMLLAAIEDAVSQQRDGPTKQMHARQQLVRRAARKVHRVPMTLWVAYRMWVDDNISASEAGRAENFHLFVHAHALGLAHPLCSAGACPASPARPTGGTRMPFEPCASSVPLHHPPAPRLTRLGPRPTLAWWRVVRA